MGERESERESSDHLRDDYRTDDDWQLEVGGVQEPADVADTRPVTRSGLGPRLSRRQRALRLLATSGVALLALLVVVMSDPAVREPLAGLIPTFPTAPAPTPVPGTNLFYLLPTPFGVDVQIDGHSLSQAQLANPTQPFRLSRGSHTITWRSASLPFRFLQCSVSEPHRAGDSCPTYSGNPDPNPDPSPAGSGAAQVGTVIAVRESLSTLTLAQADALRVAIGAALSGLQLNATVLPGEHYDAGVGADGRPLIGAATEPLQAELTYRWLNPPLASEPCGLDPPALPCRFPGQDCSAICTVPEGRALDGCCWLAAIPVAASWRYTRADGAEVASGVAEPLPEQAMALDIYWDGAAWQVSPVLSGDPAVSPYSSIASIDDLACDPGRQWLAQNNVWSFMMVDPPPGAQVKVATGTSPTDGCLLSLDQDPGGSFGPALFLEHFGALVAVNDAAASNPEAGIPLADASEVDLARHLAPGLTA